MGADTMIRYAGLFWHYFLQYAKVRLSYRSDFLISMMTAALATLFNILVVYLIFGNFQMVGGWTFEEIMFLYGFSLLPMSLFNVVSINLYYFADNYIIEGKFDRVLLRPVHSLFQVLSEQMRLEALGDAALGLALLIGCAHTLGLAWTPGRVAFLALATLCGAVIYLSVFLMLTSVSFWIEDRVGITPPVYNMLAFARYPLDIYNSFVRFLLSWVVPFGFATFYPSANLLRAGRYSLFAWLMPAVAALFFTAAMGLWNRGVRNYSSTGN